MFQYRFLNKVAFHDLIIWFIDHEMASKFLTLEIEFWFWRI